MGGTGFAARMIVLAIFVVIGAGVYAVVLKSDLKAAEVQLTTMAKDRDMYRLRAEQYASQSKDDSQAIQMCQAQVDDLTAQLDEASKRRR